MRSFPHISVKQNLKLLITLSGVLAVLAAASTVLYNRVLMVVVPAFGIASLWLSLRLQGLISGVTRALAHVTRTVSAEKVYSVRVSKVGDDDFDEVIDGVNQLIDHTQKQEEARRASEEHLRRVTEAIREVFWLAEPGSTHLSFIGPSYEQIWGHPRDTLHENPNAWLEAIHPDDHNRVMQAVLDRQSTGKYDLEYRIVKPGGLVRWIRDRGFPVRDQSGQIIQFAGLAEDITDRKLLEIGALEIREREQERIGRELHDGLCQQLVALGFASNALAQKVAEGRRPDAAEAREICDLIDQSLTQARQLARGLYPAEVEVENLAAALQELATRTGQRFLVICLLDYPHPIVFENSDVARHLYRIAQEAVINAIKHAKAHRIVIRLQSDSGQIHLRVIDDGLGIEDEAKRGSGLGMQLMGDHVRDIGGTLQVERSPEGGTIVYCACPRRRLG